ncbi:hypothetical protein DFS34DRAFT_646643 [Phlyctochytrium arcticum]|nr:hypothetical protein DFS34DRAFT_646643 [Phlyctochytrium arcticum]
MASSAVVTNEESISRLYDKCIANTLVKGGLGLSVGVGLSFLFFRRRIWPVALSTGVGLGVSYEQCARGFNPRRSRFDELN